ncbi:MAG: TolC family outer membrane protein [Formivibrio sp.]|nr:TolC family outer membrane protein [Formivibrio sp.]
MSFNLKSTLIALALASSFQVSQAASSTLPEVVEQAILRNPEVQARWHQFRAASEEVSAAKGGYLPRVDISATAGHAWQDYPVAAGGNQSFNNPGANIELRQMLFDGFATRSAVRNAGYVNQTRYYELLAASDSVAEEAARAYLDVLRYRRLTELARDNWAVHKELYDQIDSRVKAGVGRRVDLEQGAGRLALAESNWLTEASNLHDVSARFERLVGNLPADVLSEVPSLLDKLPQDGETLPLALRQNPSFLAAIANLRSSRAQLDAQKSNNYPQLEFRASQGMDRNENGIDGNYHHGQVLLALSYNLFRGGSDSARVRAAGEQLNAAFDLRDKSCRDIRQETRIAQNDLRKLAEQIRYLDQHQLSTEKARDAYRQQFDIGQRTLLDLLDTENELFEAKRALVQAEMDYQLAQIRVLTQTHRILPALKLTSLDATISDDDLGGTEADDARIACGSEAMPAIVLDRVAAMADRAPPPAVVPVLPAPVLSKQAIVAQCAEKDIAPMLNDWRNAWVSKNVDGYLNFFSTRFEPPKGQKLAAWKAMRRTRLNKSGSITLSLQQVSSKLTSENMAEVSFAQTYSADGFTDNVNKTLSLSCEGGSWKILRENVTQGRVY